jgi:LysR family glycine cleavage system transcriptional activator
MGRKIPPFAALRAFEALARRGTLHAAGRELGISAGAVSHQLKSLEDNLGVKLLTRNLNRLSITEIGLCYAAELRGILDQLESVSVSTSAAHDKSRIKISLFHSLAELWMVPLLGTFDRDEPHVLVSLLTDPEVIDISNSDVDLAILYAESPPAHCQAIELFPETIGPLASPEYLAANGPIGAPKELAGHRLIYCSCEPNEWRFWTDRCGAGLIEPQHCLEVDTRAAAIQAGEQGLGVVMGRRPLADLALARGRLVQLLKDPIATGMSYFIVVPNRTWSSRRIRDFCLWLESVACTENPFGPRQSGDPSRARSDQMMLIAHSPPGRSV